MNHFFQLSNDSFLHRGRCTQKFSSSCYFTSRHKFTTHHFRKRQMPNFISQNKTIPVTLAPVSAKQFFQMSHDHFHHRGRYKILTWDPPRFSRHKEEALSSTEFLLENDLDGLLGVSLGLPATGMFFICWKTSFEVSASPSSSILVSLLNCSLSLLSTTKFDNVGTLRPFCTTKPSSREVPEI